MNQISLFEVEGQVYSSLPSWTALPEDCRIRVIQVIAILVCRMGLTPERGENVE